MCPTVINGEWVLELPEHRAARPQWDIANGGWEKERLASMHANIEPGQLVYDIGAEEGDLPALWASWGADVVLFEPNPRVWPNIKVIFEANDLADRVRGCFVGFAGDTDTYPEGALPGTGWAGGWWPDAALGEVIGDHGFMNLCERPDVPSVTIDQARLIVGKPDAITIDVEGAELQVLEGARATLTGIDQPTVWVSIHPEFMAEMYGTHPDDIHNLMAWCGYRSKHLATDHEQHWVFWPKEREFAE